MHKNSYEFLSGYLTIDNASTNEATEILEDRGSVAARREESAKTMAKHPKYRDAQFTRMVNGFPRFSGDDGDAVRQKYGRFWADVDTKLTKLDAPGLIPKRSEEPRSDKGKAKDKSAQTDRPTKLLAQWAAMNKAEQARFLKLAGLKRA
jgi:hypothetical protein